MAQLWLEVSFLGDYPFFLNWEGWGLDGGKEFSFILKRSKRKRRFLSRWMFDK
jgi:hypothetical protein